MCGRFPGSRSACRRRGRWPPPGRRCSDTTACSRPRCERRSRWTGTAGRCSSGRRPCFPAEGRMGEPLRGRQGQLRTERQPPQGTFYYSWDITSLLPVAQDQTNQSARKRPTLFPNGGLSPRPPFAKGGWRVISQPGHCGTLSSRQRGTEWSIPVTGAGLVPTAPARRRGW